jgi:hypothetical protein
MISEKLFPNILIILMFVAGVIYLVKGDLRHALYWFAATMLNITVTY